MAKIQLNGKKIKIKPKITIYDLLKRFKINNKKVAIEHNGIIIHNQNKTNGIFFSFLSCCQ